METTKKADFTVRSLKELAELTERFKKPGVVLDIQLDEWTNNHANAKEDTDENS